MRSPVRFQSYPNRLQGCMHRETSRSSCSTDEKCLWNLGLSLNKTRTHATRKKSQLYWNWRCLFKVHNVGKVFGHHKLWHGHFMSTKRQLLFLLLFSTTVTKGFGWAKAITDFPFVALFVCQPFQYTSLSLSALCILRFRAFLWILDSGLNSDS